MKKCKLLIILALLLVWGCEEKASLPLEQPVEELLGEELIVEEEKEEENLLSPEEIAEKLLEKEGQIVSMKRGLDQALAVVEVIIKKDNEYYLYLVDPYEEKILSRKKTDYSYDELSLEEAHFLAREALVGRTDLRGIYVFDDHYRFVFEKEAVGWEVKLDKNTKESEVLGEVLLDELGGRINMDLFQAIKKTQVIYGKLDIKEIYYKPWTDSESQIVIKAQQDIEGALLEKTFIMNTYSGVITVENN